MSRAEKLKRKKQGGTTMRYLIVMSMVMVMAMGAQAVTTDSVILTVTPVFNLSVNIHASSQTFGAVDLESSKTINVGKIENDGNVTAEWKVQSANADNGGAGAWTLLASGDPGEDQFRLLAISTGVGVDPDYPGSGTEADSCIDGDHAASNDGIGVGPSWFDLTEGGAGSPKHLVTEVKDLWVSLMMPENVTSGNMQTITLSVGAFVQ